ncbi:MAG: altronate hydrolase [Firmicutes bacterium HGW-Firmicutes-1]|jgi:altronate hydrolase|nr:MAG: altronate hydrolase [Firmicutes bacterium HGW-Firmicutes-1]
MKPYIKIHEADNVLVALTDFSKGETVGELVLLEDIGKGHKVAIFDIAAGEDIIKYGAPIGKATKSISKGSFVHTHNTKTKLDDVNEYTYQPKFETVETDIVNKTVHIYRRKNGLVGIRNELWIVPTVGCINSTAQRIIDTFKSQHATIEIDGIYVFGHNYGCSQMGDDLENTKVSLQSIAKHPNAGGVLVIGLGCENNQLASFKESLVQYDEDRVMFLESQNVDDEIEEGVSALETLYSIMKTDQRVEGKLSELKIGLECGGSDGLSGITANPLLGVFSDYVNYHGGTTVLTEVPEMFGAETILMSRAKNEVVYHKIVKMVNDFKLYYKQHGQVIYDNPSPGNKKGGITTLEDKSLGCTQKAGLSKVVDVIRVGEQITERGLNLLSAPGNDLVATTSLGIVGCQLVLFTTGRGTPFGGFVPTVKISTNSELAKKKKHWIDFDAGQLTEAVPMDVLLVQFIDYIVSVVNGDKTNNEKNNAREIAIFKSGVTL